MVQPTPMHLRNLPSSFNWYYQVSLYFWCAILILAPWSGTRFLSCLAANPDRLCKLWFTGVLFSDVAGPALPCFSSWQGWLGGASSHWPVLFSLPATVRGHSKGCCVFDAWFVRLNHTQNLQFGPFSLSNSQFHSGFGTQLLALRSCRL